VRRWQAIGRAALGAALALGPGAAFVGCATAAEPVPGPPGALSVGQSREVELHFLRFDVSNFEQTLTRKDVQDLPLAVKQRLWLLDLDLSNGPNAPRLLDNALAAIRALDPATLSPAGKNLQKLLNMTPDTADLKGTNLDQLIELAPLLGISPRDVLAGLMGINVEDTFLSPQVISESILQGVIATHPNAQKRLGPVTQAHPDGLYPVTPGFLPVTLEDAVTDFATLSDRFGPVNTGGVTHPGFIAGATQAKVLTDKFKMTVRANANALPYKGVDLTTADTASVNSVPSQIRGLFDFDDPSWLRIEGLVEGIPKIDSLTFRVVENPQFIPGGRSPLPMGQGSSSAWQLPPWQLERVLIGAGERAFTGQTAKLTYTQPGHSDPLVSAQVDHGWQQIFVQAGIGSPPPPSYLWDILLEVAQVRLHDGGLAEGDAGVEITLHDIPIGTDTESITRTIRENLQADPTALTDVATRIIDSSSGAADFYYFRPRASAPTTQQGDWLFFINEGDIARDKQGKPVRAYDYKHPGFYGDVGLTKKVSTMDELEGDLDHEKVRVRETQELFVEGKGGQVFRLVVGQKNSLNSRQLTVTREK
jgi:hypothetical protein